MVTVSVELGVLEMVDCGGCDDLKDSPFVEVESEIPPVVPPPL